MVIIVIIFITTDILLHHWIYYIVAKETFSTTINYIVELLIISYLSFNPSSKNNLTNGEIMRIMSISKEDIQLIKRAVKYIKPYKMKYSLAFICILSGIGIGLIQPLVWGNLLSNLFDKGYNKVLINILYLSIIYILQAAVGFFQSYLVSFLSENIIFDLKRDIYHKILNLPVKAFDEMSSGEFISRLHGDAQAIANIITNQLLNAVIDVLRVIFVAIAVFTISVPLALIVIFSGLLTYFIFRKYGKVLRVRNKEVAKLNDRYFSSAGESIYAIREIKSLGIKKNKFESFIELAEKLKNSSININVLNTLSNTLSQGVIFLSQIAVIAAGGYLIYIGKLTMNYYIAFSSYANQFSFALINITRLNSNIQQMLTSLERIFYIMDNLSYSQEEFGNESIWHIEGNIRFKNVSFEYNESSCVLKDISIDIPKNKKIAIVGSSGSGKTTIFNLLLRFYNPSAGEILIDDINISKFNEESLRRHISIVRQEPFLFRATVKENLLLANPKASMEEIEEACRAACIHEYIAGLPEKYDSVIGENGVNISGGQRQRIAIARALLKESKIILFDEATSSLDNESQYYIKEVIDRISKDHTVIIIAHRLSTIIEADEIIVVEQGKVVGKGNHEMLIRKNATYKRLYETELNVLKTKLEEVV